MKKNTICLVICMIMISLISIPAEAHPTADEHYEELEAMLFDSRTYKSTCPEDAEKIKMIEYASTLCIDQFGPVNNQNALNELNNRDVPGIPKNVSEINPTEEENVKLSAKNHRTYTHQGWDHSYEQEQYGDLAKWPVRKDILMATTEKVFDFSLFSGKIFGIIDVGYSQQCESLDALIYYNHLLGDYLEDIESGDVNKFNGKTNGLKIPFASKDINPEDLFSELEKHLAILFEEESGTSRVYDMLISEIDTVAEKARLIADTEDGQITEDKLEAMGKCVHELMDILTGENGHFNAIHNLLTKEKFFTKIFDSE